MASNFRRTWDVKEVKRKALERDQDKAARVKKKLKIASNIEEIGEKREVKKYNFETSSVALTRKQFYCSICDVQTNDSLSFTSHLSSKLHCKNLGVKVQIERSNLQQVQERFKKLKEQKFREGIIEGTPSIVRLKSEIKKRKKKTKDPDDQIEPENLEVAQIMGFKAFGKS